MNLKKILSILHNKSKGTTLIEIVVSMTMMTILGFSLWGAFSMAMRTSERIPSVSKVGVQLLTMDSTIRNLLNRIKMPFYLHKVDGIEESGYELKLPYFDGDPEKFLYFYFEDDMLEVSTIFPEDAEIEVEEEEVEVPELDENSDEFNQPLVDPDPVKIDFRDEMLEPILVRFGPFEDFSIDLEENEPDQPVSVEIEATPVYENYGDIYIYVRLGSQPLWVE